MAATLVGQHVFYNNSAFDDNDTAAGENDAPAFADDKTGLMPGQSATFANYASYEKGINGIMVDIDGLPGEADKGLKSMALTPPEQGLVSSVVRVDTGAGMGQVSAHDAVLEQAAGQESAEQEASTAQTDWLYEFEQMDMNTQPSKNDNLAKEAVDELLFED